MEKSIYNEKLFIFDLLMLNIKYFKKNVKMAQKCIKMSQNAFYFSVSKIIQLKKGIYL